MHELLDDFDARFFYKETLSKVSEELARVPESWEDKLFLNSAVHLFKLFQCMCLIQLNHIICDTSDDGQIGQIV